MLKLCEPIEELQAQIESIERGSASLSSLEEKIGAAILDAVRPPMYELQKGFKLLSTPATTISKECDRASLASVSALEAMIPPLHEIQNSLARIGEDVESGLLQQDDSTAQQVPTVDSSRLLQTMAQSVLYFQNNIDAMHVPDSDLRSHLTALTTDLSKLIEVSVSDGLGRYNIMVLENVKKPIDDLNYCLRQIEERSQTGWLQDLMEPLSALREKSKRCEDIMLLTGHSKLDASVVILSKIKHTVESVEDILSKQERNRDAEDTPQPTTAEQIQETGSLLDELQTCLHDMKEHDPLDARSISAYTEEVSMLKSLAQPLASIKACLDEVKHVTVQQASFMGTKEVSTIQMLASPLQEVVATLAQLKDSAESSADDLQVLLPPLQELHHCVGIINDEIKYHTEASVEAAEQQKPVIATAVQPFLELYNCIGNIINQICEPHEDLSTMDDISMLKTIADPLPLDETCPIIRNEHVTFEAAPASLASDVSVHQSQANVLMDDLQRYLVNVQPQIIETLMQLKSADYSTKEAVLGPIMEIEKSIAAVQHTASVYDQSVHTLRELMQPLQLLEHHINKIQALQLEQTASLAAANVNLDCFAIPLSDIKDSLHTLQEYIVENVLDMTDFSAHHSQAHVQIGDDELQRCLAIVKQPNTLEALESLSSVSNLSSLMTLAQPIQELRSCLQVQQLQPLFDTPDSMSTQTNLSLLKQLAKPLVELRQCLLNIEIQSNIDVVKHLSEYCEAVTARPIVELCHYLHGFDVAALERATAIQDEDELSDLQTWADQKSVSQFEVVHQSVHVIEPEAKVSKDDVTEGLRNLNRCLDSVQNHNSFEIAVPMDNVEVLDPITQSLATVKEALLAIQRDENVNLESVLENITTPLLNLNKAISDIRERITSEPVLGNLMDPVEELQSCLVTTLENIIETSPTNLIISTLERPNIDIAACLEKINGMSVTDAVQIECFDVSVLRSPLVNIHKNIDSLQRSVASKPLSELSRCAPDVQKFIASMQEVESELYFVQVALGNTADKHPIVREVAHQVTELKQAVAELQNSLQISNDIQPLILNQTTQMISLPVQRIEKLLIGVSEEYMYGAYLAPVAQIKNNLAAFGVLRSDIPELVTAMESFSSIENLVQELLVAKMIGSVENIDVAKTTQILQDISDRLQEAELNAPAVSIPFKGLQKELANLQNLFTAPDFNAQSVAAVVIPLEIIDIHVQSVCRKLPSVVLAHSISKLSDEVFAFEKQIPTQNEELSTLANLNRSLTTFVNVVNMSEVIRKKSREFDGVFNALKDTVNDLSIQHTLAQSIFELQDQIYELQTLPSTVEASELINLFDGICATMVKLREQHSMIVQEEVTVPVDEITEFNSTAQKELISSKTEISPLDTEAIEDSQKGNITVQDHVVSKKTSKTDSQDEQTIEPSIKEQLQALQSQVEYHELAKLDLVEKVKQQEDTRESSITSSTVDKIQSQSSVNIMRDEADAFDSGVLVTTEADRSNLDTVDPSFIAPRIIDEIDDANILKKETEKLIRTSEERELTPEEKDSLQALLAKINRLGCKIHATIVDAKIINESTADIITELKEEVKMEEELKKNANSGNGKDKTVHVQPKANENTAERVIAQVEIQTENFEESSAENKTLYSENILDIEFLEESKLENAADINIENVTLSESKNPILPIAGTSADTHLESLNMLLNSEAIVESTSSIISDTKLPVEEQLQSTPMDITNIDISSFQSDTPAPKEDIVNVVTSSNSAQNSEIMIEKYSVEIKCEHNERNIEDELERSIEIKSSSEFESTSLLTTNIETKPTTLLTEKNESSLISTENVDSHSISSEHVRDADVLDDLTHNKEHDRGIQSDEIQTTSVSVDIANSCILEGIKSFEDISNAQITKDPFEERHIDKHAEASESLDLLTTHHLSPKDLSSSFEELITNDDVVSTSEIEQTSSQLMIPENIYYEDTVSQNKEEFKISLDEPVCPERELKPAGVLGVEYVESKDILEVTTSKTGESTNPENQTESIDTLSMQIELCEIRNSEPVRSTSDDISDICNFTPVADAERMSTKQLEITILSTELVPNLETAIDSPTIEESISQHIERFQEPVLSPSTNIPELCLPAPSDAMDVETEKHSAVSLEIEQYNIPVIDTISSPIMEIPEIYDNTATIVDVESTKHYDVTPDLSTELLDQKTSFEENLITKIEQSEVSDLSKNQPSTMDDDTPKQPMEDTSKTTQNTKPLTKSAKAVLKLAASLEKPLFELKSCMNMIETIPENAVITLKTKDTAALSAIVKPIRQLVDFIEELQKFIAAETTTPSFEASLRPLILTPLSDFMVQITKSQQDISKDYIRQDVSFEVYEIALPLEELKDEVELIQKQMSRNLRFDREDSSEDQVRLLTESMQHMNVLVGVLLGITPAVSMATDEGIETIGDDSLTEESEFSRKDDTAVTDRDVDDLTKDEVENIDDILDEQLTDLTHRRTEDILESTSNFIECEVSNKTELLELKDNSASEMAENLEPLSSDDVIGVVHTESKQIELQTIANIVDKDISMPLLDKNKAQTKKDYKDIHIDTTVEVQSTDDIDKKRGLVSKTDSIIKDQNQIETIARDEPKYTVKIDESIDSGLTIEIVAETMLPPLSIISTINEDVKSETCKPVKDENVLDDVTYDKEPDIEIKTQVIQTKSPSDDFQHKDSSTQSILEDIQIDQYSDSTNSSTIQEIDISFVASDSTLVARSESIEMKPMTQDNLTINQPVVTTSEIEQSLNQHYDNTLTQKIDQLTSAVLDPMHPEPESKYASASAIVDAQSIQTKLKDDLSLEVGIKKSSETAITMGISEEMCLTTLQVKVATTEQSEAIVENISIDSDGSLKSEMLEPVLQEYTERSIVDIEGSKQVEHIAPDKIVSEIEQLDINKSTKTDKETQSTIQNVEPVEEVLSTYPKTESFLPDMDNKSEDDLLINPSIIQKPTGHDSDRVQIIENVVLTDVNEIPQKNEVDIQSPASHSLSKLDLVDNTVSVNPEEFESEVRSPIEVSRQSSTLSISSEKSTNVVMDLTDVLSTVEKQKSISTDEDVEFLEIQITKDSLVTPSKPSRRKSSTVISEVPIRDQQVINLDETLENVLPAAIPMNFEQEQFSEQPTYESSTIELDQSGKREDQIDDTQQFSVDNEASDVLINKNECIKIEEPNKHTSDFKSESNVPSKEVNITSCSFEKELDKSTETKDTSQNQESSAITKIIEKPSPKKSSSPKYVDQPVDAKISAELELHDIQKIHPLDSRKHQEDSQTEIQKPNRTKSISPKQDTNIEVPQTSERSVVTSISPSPSYVSIEDDTAELTLPDIHLISTEIQKPIRKKSLSPKQDIQIDNSRKSKKTISTDILKSTTADSKKDDLVGNKTLNESILNVSKVIQKPMSEETASPESDREIVEPITSEDTNNATMKSHSDDTGTNIIPNVIDATVHTPEVVLEPIACTSNADPMSTKIGTSKLSDIVMKDETPKPKMRRKNSDDKKSKSKSPEKIEIDVDTSPGTTNLENISVKSELNFEIKNSIDPTTRRTEEFTTIVTQSDEIIDGHRLEQRQTTAKQKIELELETAKPVKSPKRSRESKRPPVIDSRLTNRSASIGTPVKLTCTYSGIDVHTQWFKDNEPIETNERYHIMQRDGIATLELVQSGTIDSGLYACIVSNANGEVETTATIKIFEDVSHEVVSAPVFSTGIRGELSYAKFHQRVN